MDYEAILKHIATIVGILGGLSSFALNIQQLKNNKRKNNKKRRPHRKGKRRK
ncbi:hypothetical protein [Lysinibacillus capsici]|uniref:hypothetical protein n=1 Tax=Lysinibacillus capsici TaxID=2115968 RepID=UPI0013140964|nr:hypothetical protein [Lysinibacillus capsici]